MTVANMLVSEFVITAYTACKAGRLKAMIDFYFHWKYEITSSTARMALNSFSCLCNVFKMKTKDISRFHLAIVETF